MRDVLTDFSKDCSATSGLKAIALGRALASMQVFLRQTIRFRGIEPETKILLRKLWIEKKLISSPTENIDLLSIRGIVEFDTMCLAHTYSGLIWGQPRDKQD